MKNKDIEIVAAGHTCLDLIPAFTIEGKVDKMTDVLVPGKMINMGKCVVVGGGPVNNAGVSIRRLGVKAKLIGKVGDNDFGNQIIQWYEEHDGHFKGIHQVKGESTSYTIAVCIPGIDRFYLHHCGANDTFGYDDMNFKLIEHSKLTLFRYPPWRDKLYSNDAGTDKTGPRYLFPLLIDKTLTVETKLLARKRKRRLHHVHRSLNSQKINIFSLETKKWYTKLIPSGPVIRSSNPVLHIIVAADCAASRSSQTLTTNGSETVYTLSSRAVRCA